jgi:uncharacterized protein
VQLIDGQPVYAATDLVGFLACSHRLALERAALAGLVRKPIRSDPAIDLIAKRGDAHERRYLAELRASGKRVTEIQRDGSAATAGDDLRAAAADTEAAMRDGVDVVYQATFFDGRWRGHADFLLRVERPSDLGSWSYEVADTKLARHVTGGAILQICSYVDQLTRVQGMPPERLSVVLGGSERRQEWFRVSDYMAYYRRVKAEFEAAVAAGEPVYPVTASYPDPVEHCEVCKWIVDCKAQRRRDDDLSLVAGISTKQRRALKDRGTKTRRGLAALDLPVKPRLEGVSAEALERVRAQARIQVAGEDSGQMLSDLLEPERDDDTGTLVADRGFLVLPPPSPHDLFFDIEGDPFAFEDGIEYLFGVLEPALMDSVRQNVPLFHEIWSRDADGEVTLAAEKVAFERLVDLLIGRLDADPTMHVYHYAAYEKTALAKLAQRHATREAEVDRLLVARVLVDLFRVVRQGIRASVESYSIKRLEPLYGLTREVELKSASSSIVAFETWLEGGTAENGEVGEAILQSIAGYNRDDVLSNWRLRDWLELRRLDLEKQIGEAVPRPSVKPEATTPEEPTERQQRVAQLVAALTEGVSDPPNLDTEPGAKWLLAQLLDWHRREEKAYWWRYYELVGLTDEERVDEREPLGQVELIDDVGPINKAGTRRQTFRFPLQDHGLKVGRDVINPATVTDDYPSPCGTVEAIDEVGLTITLKRTTGNLAMGVPTSLVPFERFPTEQLKDSLARTAEWVLEHGLDASGSGQAARDLLRRRRPRTRDDGTAALTLPWSLTLPGETPLAAAVRLGLALDASMLPIQGPPGSGKTYTAAQMVLALVADGRKVGVTANSHKVIGHALDEIAKAAREAKDPKPVVRIGQRPAPGEDPTSTVAVSYETNDKALAALAADEIDVIGATAFIWSREDYLEAVDVLFVDEAGQFSLANAVAVAPAARSLVLLGDPQQLNQPLQGSHPPGAEQSALGHVLAMAEVIDDSVGLFLTDTWRLHPDVRTFTSEVFYENRVGGVPSLAVQALRGTPPADGTGVRWLPVVHAGDATESVEEAAAIVEIVRELLEGDATWTDRHGVSAPITLDDVLIVAPYNAHVERIAVALADAGYRDARVGTVDKFQGQEAPISIYAMATSTAEEAPRGLEFLFSRNRLNVATSRARCVAIVIASPDLVRVQCKTPRQMWLANALCRLVELADRGPSPA